MRIEPLMRPLPFVLPALLATCSPAQDPVPLPAPTDDPLPASSPTDQPVARETPIAVCAATTGGIALLDTAGSMLARADTDWPVTDIAFDPLSKTIVVAEYEDDSASRISAWTVTDRAGVLHLDRLGSCPIDAYGLVFPTDAGVLLIEQTGLDTAWSVWDPGLAHPLWRTHQPAPASLFPWNDERYLWAGVVVRDHPDHPSAELVLWHVTEAALGVEARVSLGARWAGAEPVRACPLTPPVVALSRAHGWSIDVATFDVSLGTETHAASFATTSPGDVVDMLCDPLNERSFTLIAGSAHPSLVMLDRMGQAHWIETDLPPVIAHGAWPSRHLALDHDHRRLLVAGPGYVAAVETQHADYRVAWTNTHARWPVEIVDGLLDPR